MKFLLTGAAIAAMTFAPAAAHAQFGGFGGGNTLFGAGAGAGIGALIAGSGNNVEGALLGAALGGVASNAFTPQGQSFGGGGFGGFGNNSTVPTLAGAGAGAGIGALIAGRGNNVEGALLGAALGGVAGNALAPQFQNRGFNGQQGGFQQGGFPVQQGFPVQGGYQGGYQGGFVPQYVGVPRYAHSGQYVSGNVVPVTRYIQPAPVVQPIHVQRTVYVQRPAPAPVVHRVHVPAPQIQACPSNTTPQADGTCLDRQVTQYSNPVQGRSSSSRTEPCPADSRKQADGTCLTSMVTHIDRTAYHAPVQQPVVYHQPVQTVTAAPQQVFCYNGSSTQYDDCGRNLSNTGTNGWFSNPFK